MSPKALLTLSLLPGRYAVARLDPTASLPVWALEGDFYSICRSPDELSIVCAEQYVPEGVRCEKGWRTFKFEGPLDFSLTGIVASVADPLAEAGVSIFPIATYDTDYLLIKEQQVEPAIQALTTYGHAVRT